MFAEMQEVAPGVHRIPFAIGPKPMAMYILAGDRLTLIDTGIPDTPATVYLPAIAALGRQPEEVGLVVITHADADHIGGNSAVRQLFPNAQFLCHALDQRWASDPAVITAERYDGFRRFGLRYDQAVFDFLAGWMGPAVPMDILVQGGERLRIRDDDWLEVLHVPGHTPGHLLLYNREHRYAIAGDALFGASQVDTAGGWSAPPPYTTVNGYRTTLQTIAALDLDLLLTCHYPVMRGAEIAEFIATSRDFIDRATLVVRRLLHETAGSVRLADAIAFADPMLGAFAFARDLQFALVAHLDEEVTRGNAVREIEDGTVVWRSTGVMA